MIDFRRLDLNLLLVLDALFEEASATAVASRLKISQPTVSYSLAKLRDLFADPLFVRAGGRLEPTSLAMSLRDPIRQAIEIIEHKILPVPEFDQGKSHRQFRISTSDVGELCFLPLLIKALRAHAPFSSLNNILLEPHDLGRALETGRLDAAIGYFPDLPSTDFMSEILFEHPFVVIARAGHPLIDRLGQLDTFLKAEHATVEAKGRSQEILERTMAASGLQRRIALTTPYFMSLPFLVSTSDLIATVPRAVATAYPAAAGLRILEPPVDLPTIVLALHWQRRTARSRDSIWLRALMMDLFSGRDPTAATV